MGFAAHFSLDPGRPIDVDRMMLALAPGGQRSWRGPGAAIGVADGCALATGPGDRVALLDGRLHNRGELVALAGGDAARFDDAELLLAVHEKCGESVVDRAIGDCAFVIWDGVERRALLSVDPGGMRTLVAHARDGELFVASEAAALFAGAGIARRIDETRVAEWLALLAAEDATRTFFAGIVRVPPGGRGTWSGRTLAIERWWHPDRLPMLRLSDHAAYAEAVGTALDAAVACRLDGAARIGSHLSGGLDSGTVTALAARRLVAGGGTLTAFTAVPDRAVGAPPGRFGDEWPHAAAVAALYPNVDHVAVANADMALTDLLDLREPAQDVPLLNVANAVWNNAIERQANDRGIAVMLVGTGGNMSFSYDGSPLVGRLMRDGRYARAIAETLAMRRTGGWPWRSAAGHLSAAALPPAWHDRLRRLIGRRIITPADCSAIEPGFAARTGVAERLARGEGDPRRAPARDSRALRLAVLRRNDIAGELANGARRLYGIDTRDPTLDRRLVELCLSIPDQQFQHRGVPRAIARTLATDLLPRAVRDERRRGLQAADWAHGVAADLPRLRADVASLAAGRSTAAAIDVARLQRAVDGFDASTADAVEWTAVTRALAAGRFVRRVEGGER